MTVLLCKFCTMLGVDAGESESLFNPGVFNHGRVKEYRNTPVFAGNASRVELAQQRPVDKPYGLRHKAKPPGKDAVMGLAAYPKNIRAFRRLVGSLRSTGYDGHIILGVSDKIPLSEENYLIKMDVTMYTVAMVQCDESISVGGEVKGNIRGKCSRGLERLKLEWGRFEMCRQWLKACAACTGWSLVMDTRDLFFQAHPFSSLGDASTSDIDLYFVEEIAPHSSPDPNPTRSFIAGNFRNRAHTVPCYGKERYEAYSQRPVLCSGTVIGNRAGMMRFLSVLVDEFYTNNAKENMKCRSPITTDQWTMNWLYYNGDFGGLDRTRTLPWGTGPVQTVGKACMTAERKQGASDIVKRDPARNGLIVNIHDGMVAPVVHQFDRCHPWVGEWFEQHPELVGANPNKGRINVEEVQPVPWLVQNAMHHFPLHKDEVAEKPKVESTPI